MSKLPRKDIVWSTPDGDVRIRSFCFPEEIRHFTLDSQFGTHARYKSLYTKRESLEKIAAQPENLFMCRIGKNVSDVLLNRFKWLRFGLSPWTWAD